VGQLNGAATPVSRPGLVGRPDAKTKQRDAHYILHTTKAIFCKEAQMNVDMILDTKDPVSVRAYALSLAALSGGIHGDIGLIVDAAEKFTSFLWPPSNGQSDEHRFASLPLPRLEPEAPSLSSATPE
jgi:hypothetical protein